MVLICPSFQKLIIGKNGQKVAKIADQSSQDLANTFRRDVFVKLDVVYKQKKWNCIIIFKVLISLFLQINTYKMCIDVYLQNNKFEVKW